MVLDEFWTRIAMAVFTLVAAELEFSSVQFSKCAVKAFSKAPIIEHELKTAMK